MNTLNMKDLDIGDGHRLVNNKVGDYDLVCPKLGRLGFVPFMLARFCEGKICDCGHVATKPVKLE